MSCETFWLGYVLVSQRFGGVFGAVMFWSQEILALRWDVLKAWQIFVINFHIYTYTYTFVKFN